MARSYGGEKKPDDVLEAIVAVTGVLVMVIGMVWFMRGEAWVRSWTSPLYAMSRAWLWVPGDAWAAFAEPLVLSLHATGRQFLSNPKEVSFFAWMGYIQWTLLPVSLLIGLCAGLGTLRVLLIKPKPIFDVLTPTQLMEVLSWRFTGIAPVVHLRKALAKNTDPLWRRQTFPHEVLLKERVNGKPLVIDDQMVEETARAYFMGIEVQRQGGEVKPIMKGDRLSSKMLGQQVVNLVSDAGKPNICYADRMSAPGKVLYALLAARAFGGEEGRADYEKARDQLNNSCRGEKSGRPNLTVAQWLYDKYRMNAVARRVCAVHHWEHTVLWALLVYAKRQGKCGHWEWVWLKPTSRILFYALNTVGRLTPHTESAAAFCQYIFERRVAKRRRLPLMKQPTGGFVHVIYVEKAIKGLALEWERWRDGVDDRDGDFWMSDDAWSQLTALNLAPPEPPPELRGDTPFDAHMRAREELARSAPHGSSVGPGNEAGARSPLDPAHGL